MGWASGFTALCFFAEGLFIAPPVFSTVPAEFNIFNPSFRMFFAALRSGLVATSHPRKNDGCILVKRKINIQVYNDPFSMSH